MVEHINTNSMLIDPLTKGLRPVFFQESHWKYEHYKFF